MTTAQAAHGEKMIEVKIRFWTNDIADEKDHVIPGHCWSKGVVSVPGNQSHGIRRVDPIHFHSLLDLPHVIEQVMSSAGIRVHTAPTRALYE